METEGNDYEFILSEYPIYMGLLEYLALADFKREQYPEDFTDILEINDKYKTFSLKYLSNNRVTDIFKFRKDGRLLASSHVFYNEGERCRLIRFINEETEEVTYEVDYL